ncbi:MAG: DUF4857 domain-containing protein [Campylobacteraceae bacterium]|jgi:hypothetical protein|nr:DUF4857 domain-containing protein [Campylobacteraceae bacterium]
MRINLPRFALFLISVTAFFWFIPNFYNKASKPDRFWLNGSFSPITKEFVISESTPEKFTYKNENGDELDKISAQKMLPFMFYNNINKWQSFPLQSIDGSIITYNDVKDGTQILRLSARDVSSEALPLFTLLESSPVGAYLDMPSDMLLIKQDRVIFIDCASGKVDEEKSQRFTKALKDSGVMFPILKAFSNPTNLKPFDEGLIFADNVNKLFQLKMVEGAPFVKQISDTLDAKVLFINVSEDERRLFYGLVVTEGGVYINTYEEGLKKLPLDGYNPRTTSLNAYFTSLYHSVTSNDLSLKNPPVHFRALTRNFDIAREYQKDIPQSIVQKRERISYVLSFLTPFSISQFSAFSNEVLFDIKFAPNAVFALLGIVFALILYIALNFKKRVHILDLVAICFTGIAGLISLQIFGSFSKKSLEK